MGGHFPFLPRTPSEPLEFLELRIVRELHGIEKGASEKEKGETVRAKEIVASSQSFKGATSEDEGGEADKRQEVIKRAIF